MKKGRISIITICFFALILLIAGCSNSNGKENSKEKSGQDSEVSLGNIPEKFKSGEEVKIKVIRKIGGDDHTEQFLAGAKEEGEAMGLKVDVFSAGGDSKSFHNEITKSLEEGYDGFIISHGDDPETIDSVKKIVEKGKSVVTFDSNTDLAKIDGVTLTSQNDEVLATLAMEQLIEDFDGQANIAYLWVDGFPPMVRRNAVYMEKLKNNPGIKEIERFGVASADTSGETKAAVAEMLKKHPKGEIDAIFATWDAFAIGAAEAIKEAGRDEIKIYGIDVSNTDLNLMKEEGSPWKYTAAVDPKLIGALNMRLVAKKIAGEETPKTYNLEPYLIAQNELQVSKKEVTMNDLGEVLPGWGLSTELEEDWMKTLKIMNE
ncbi:sugar ABC transporter substrate-binding protein [Cytobacillus dafuensis]|uniref:Sugar ABC transporter substrate-binding protein n=1 Tax=Cytobacillus dafuensis TaxID=1742359 RepID=A0A5B8Z4Y2_CYTDA|nr:sugar ABC transporter substrate-binding protein [Cytobacillus dafuensis]QED48125.1 sugar ABC transporter substrate-binding protein [Cytobacillus dafuensis]